MKKFLNSRDHLVEEMIDGFVLAFGNAYRRLEGRNALVVRDCREKVSVVTGGGSGGEPWCIGCVGEGYADGVAVGNVFAAPPATTIAAVCREIYNKQGILLVAGNHAGDAMNFELAAEILSLETDIRCETLLVTDDLSTSPIKSERSGLAGNDIIVHIAASAALAGLDLNGVKSAAEKANRNLSTLSATLELGANPVTEISMGKIGPEEVHIGTGVTGEPAMFVTKMDSAADISEILTEYLVKDLDLKSGDEVSLYLNGGGTVTVMEELIMCREIYRRLSEKGVRIFDVDLHERIKVEKTNSITVSILKLDEQLKEYMACPAHSPLIAKNHD